MRKSRHRWLSVAAIAVLAAACGNAAVTTRGTSASPAGSAGTPASSSSPSAAGVSPPPTGANASPTVDAGASPTSSLGPLPSPPPLPGPTASIVPASPGYTLFKLPLEKLRRVALPKGVTFHGIDNDGPRFVMDEPPMSSRSSTQARALIYVDLTKGSCEILKTLEDGFLFVNPRIQWPYVAWVEYRGENVDWTGVMQYRLNLWNLESGETWQLEKGLARTFPGVSIDGGELAVSVTDENRLRTKIRVYDVATRAVVRSLYTDEPVLSMGLSGGAVAYTQGKLEPVKDFLYELRMMLWRPGQKPAELVKNANFMSFRDGRLAWAQDRPEVIGGQPQHTRIYTSLVADFKPTPAAPPEEQGGEHQQEWPSTGSGYVTWGSERNDIEDMYLGGDHLGLWDPATRVAYELEPTAFAIQSSSRGGWLVWVQEGLDGVSVVYGIPFSELGLPT